MPDVKEFLSPTGTLTPGIGGGLAIAISLPIAINFHMSVKWIALAVSFLLGSVIVLSFKDRMSTLLRSVYWVLDSLIIFATAIGVGINVDGPPAPPSPTSLPPQVERLLKTSEHPWWPLGGSVAFAQTGTPPKSGTPVPGKERPESRPAPAPTKPEERELSKTQLEELKKYLQEQQQFQQKQREYQKRWSW